VKTIKYKATNTDNLNTAESRITTVTSSYATWLYPSQCLCATKKDVVYVAWKQKTYIVIVDKENINQTYTIAIFDSVANSTPKHKIFRNSDDVYEVGENSNLGADTNKVMKVAAYKDDLLYMLHQNVGYDIKRGNVYVRPGSGIKDRVLDRTGTEIANIATAAFASNDVLKPVADFNPWRIIINNKMSGIVIPSGDETVICTFTKGSNDRLNVRNVKRFGVNGVYIRGELLPNDLSTNGEEKEEDDKDDKDDKDAKGYAETEDYILKTQVVPPVCPTCPACPGKVACTNCGGNGGSGTLTSGGKSIVSENNGRGGSGNIIKGATQLAGDVVSGADNIARDAVGGTVGLAKDAVGGTVGLAKDAVGGTVGLARDAVGGTVGLAKDAVGGTVGLAKDAVGGTVGLLTGAASGVAGLFKPNPTRLGPNTMGSQGMGSQGMGSQGMGSQAIGNANYFGAIPQKESTNYMPITADFSAFSR
jgi:hypothetical protein